MKSLYRINISSNLSLEEAWNILESKGVEILYGSEEEDQIDLFAHLSHPKHELSPYNWVKGYQLHIFPPIDWETQWKAHGQNFKEGYVHVDLSHFNPSAPILRLKPGCGFGDLSHPTTTLVLEELVYCQNEQLVVDIGCGSGILTLTAVALGAPVAYGIDIDIGSLTHSQENALINKIDQCHFFTPKEFIWERTSTSILILMNMIFTEQQAAWASLPQLHSQPAECITSGIRLEEREKYLAQAKDWGWKLLTEKEDKKWLAFHFTNNLN